MELPVMVKFIFVLTTLSALTTIAVAEEQRGAPSGSSNSAPRSEASIVLGAGELSIATGQPSLVVMSSGSVHVPVWSLSGGTVGQSVAGVVKLPESCQAVKIEIVVTTDEASTGPDVEDVYRVHLSQMGEDAPFTEQYSQGVPVRAAVPVKPFHTRTIVLEPYYEVDPSAPLWLRIQREPGDPADTFPRPAGLVMVKVTPVARPAKSHVVENVSGYNSWPMMQAIGNKLVCVYSRGAGHTIGEDSRAVYARTSTDGGKSWTPETVVANTPGYGEVPVGKGLDADGAMLLWIRRVGAEWHQDLYRTTDGVTFTLITTPKLEVLPVQITDVFAVPNVGLMSLWFAGNYRNEPTNAWGTVVSKDNGATWVQNVVESDLPRDQWPTEPSAVFLGGGRILGIARIEMGGTTTVRAQFQLESSDSGATWTRSQTNITDVAHSTPSLVFDAKTGLLSNYYYHRGVGPIRRRVVDPQKVFGHPLHWPASDVVATGSAVMFDAGNVNATVIGDTHYLSFYSGKAPDTAVVVSAVPSPVACASSSEQPPKTSKSFRTE